MMMMEEHRNTIVLCAFSLLKIFIHSQALANGTNCSEPIAIWERILSGWTNTGLSGKSLFTTCAEILGWSEVTRVWIEVRSFLQDDLNPRQKEKFCALDGKLQRELGVPELPDGRVSFKEPAWGTVWPQQEDTQGSTLGLSHDHL